MLLLSAALAVAVLLVLAALFAHVLERTRRADEIDVDERRSSVRRLRRDDWGFRWVD